MAETTNIEDRNFLSPLNFKFQLKRAPATNFFIQKINIPDISITPGMVPNPFIKYPVMSDQMKFGDLNIEFKVDEELQNYMELSSWLRFLGKPDEFELDKKFDDPTRYNMNDPYYSDISVLLLNNNKETGFEIKYIDALPISLSAMGFQTTDNNVNYIGAKCTFKYTSFDILKYNF